MNNKVLAIILVVFLFGAAWYTVAQKSAYLPQEYGDSITQARDNAKKGMYKKAIANYKEALSVKSDDINIQLELANVYLTSGDDRGFVRYCNNLTKSFPKNEEPYNALAEYYNKASEYVDCYKVINNAKRRKISSETLSNIEKEIKYKYETMHKTFSDVKVFNEGMCPVKIKEKWGFVNEAGSVAISSYYQDAGVFTGGIAAVKTEKETFFINTKGEREMVPEENFDTLGSFREVAAASQNGKYFYVDKDFNKKFGDYDFASNFSNKVAAVKKFDKWALIDITGKELTGYNYEDIKLDEKGNCFRNGVAFVKENGKYYMVDSTGTKITDSAYDDVCPFSSSEPTAVKIGNLWGFVDNTGNVVIKPHYEGAKSFNNGLAAVKTGDLWGYITIDDNIVIPAKYEDAIGFSDKGAACVKVNDVWVVIKLCEYMS